MLKQIIQLILLLALSIAVILAMPYVKHAIQGILAIHDWISQSLMRIFSDGQAGNLARGLIALLSVPVLVGLISALIYWLIKRSWLPYFMDIVWVIWLVQTGALVVASQ